MNLPSSNKYHRPANYVLRGYRTRCMAVDYAIPLVTNVKNAKLLIEALARNISLDVSKIDAQTSHRIVSITGVVNISDTNSMNEVTHLLADSGYTDYT